MLENIRHARPSGYPLALVATHRGPSVPRPSGKRPGCNRRRDVLYILRAFERSTAPVRQLFPRFLPTLSRVRSPSRAQLRLRPRVAPYFRRHISGYHASSASKMSMPPAGSAATTSQRTPVRRRRSHTWRRPPGGVIAHHLAGTRPPITH